MSREKRLSLDPFFDKVRRDCGDFMLQRVRIYLDTKYWIFMRDVLTGNADHTKREIYNSLLRLVENDKVICPLSGHIFLELLKRQNLEDRKYSAAVMDNLSRGYSFIWPTEIFGQELISFIRNAQAKRLGLPPFDSSRLVWTRTPFMFGEVYPQHPYSDKFPHEFSRFKLVDIIRGLPLDYPTTNDDELVERLNKGKDANQKWENLHELFMDEVAGVLDVCNDELLKIWEYLLKNDAHLSFSKEDILKHGDTKKLKNLIYRTFDANKIGVDLPFIRIHASIHAYVRLNKAQRYKLNDLIDYGHSSCALPYCQYFFSEHPLTDLINEKTKLSSLYTTTVLSKEEDVLNCLSRIN